VCSTLLPSGASCGIAACGRCLTCGSPFCTSHQEVVVLRSNFDGLTSALPQARCVACAATALRSAAKARYDAAKASQDAERRAADRSDEARREIPSLVRALNGLGNPDSVTVKRGVDVKTIFGGWKRKEVDSQPFWRVGAARCRWSYLDSCTESEKPMIVVCDGGAILFEEDFAGALGSFAFSGGIPYAGILARLHAIRRRSGN